MDKTDVRPHVVIIGGGFAGLHAAQSLKKAAVDITLIDRRNFHLFQPLLYQVATAALSPADIACPLRQILRHQKNVRVMMAEVVDFAPEQRKVILQDGEIDYDFLIVATGAGQHYFGHDNWASHAPGMKTIEDALEVRKRILLAFEMAERETNPQAKESWLNFVIIGGGPTGVELAGTLGEIAHDAFRHDFKSYDTSQARIIMIEAGEKILPTFPDRLGAKAVRALEKLGVTVMTGARVIDIGDGYVKLKTGDTEKTFSSKTVLWAAGVTASPLGRILAGRTGVKTDRTGRIIVTPDLSLSGFSEVFVVGDLAYVEDANAEPLPGVAPVAVQAGKYVAEAITARLKRCPIKPFRYRDPGIMATIGRSEAIARIGRFQISGFLGWLVWVFIHLMNLVEFENRLLVFIHWAWNYVTFNRSARLITGPATLPPVLSNNNNPN